LDAWEILQRFQTEGISDTGMKKATSMEDKAGPSSTKKTSEEDKAGTSVEKTVREDQTIGVEATGAEDMQLEPERELLPLSLQFHPKALRTPRLEVQAAPQAPTPSDSSPSDESMWSGPSERSGDSRSDPNDSDYDPKKDA
jgi:hypothetical protein